MADARLESLATQQEAVAREISALNTFVGEAADELTSMDSVDGSHLDLVDKHEKIQVKTCRKSIDVEFILLFNCRNYRRDCRPEKTN